MSYVSELQKEEFSDGTHVVVYSTENNSSAVRDAGVIKEILIFTASLLVLLLFYGNARAGDFICAACTTYNCHYIYDSAADACAIYGGAVKVTDQLYRCKDNTNIVAKCQGHCGAGQYRDLAGDIQCVNVNQKPDCDSAQGNPILTRTGGKRQWETDYRYHGIVPVSIERVYDFLDRKGYWYFAYTQHIDSVPYGSWNVIDGFDYGGYYTTIDRANGERYLYEGLVVENGSQLFTSRVLYSQYQLQVHFVSSAISGYTLTHTDGSIESFDANGVLVSIETPEGFLVTIDTGQDGQTGLPIKIITDSVSGIVMMYYYDVLDRIVSIAVTHSSPVNEIFEYHYSYDDGVDGSGLLDKVTYPDGSTIKYRYGENGAPTKALTSKLDEEGSVYASWQYDSISGRAIHSSRGNASRQIDITYAADPVSGLIDSAMVTNAAGKQQHLHFADLGNNRRRVSRSEGMTLGGCAPSDSYFTYDDNGWKVTITEGVDLLADPVQEGVVTHYVRDETGSPHRVTAKITGLQWGEEKPWNMAQPDPATLQPLPESQKVELDWHTLRDQVIEKRFFARDENNSAWIHYKTIAYDYDDGINHDCDNRNNIDEVDTWRLCSRRVTDVVDGITREWTYTYQLNGSDGVVNSRLVNGPGPGNTDSTVYTYNSAGQLVSRENALSHMTTYGEYNGFGFPRHITDSNGVLNTLDYDLRGRVTSITADSGSGGASTTTQFAWYANGLLKRIDWADSSFVEYYYNAAHELVGLENQFGEYVEFTPSVISENWSSLKICTEKTGAGCDASNVIFERIQDIDALGRVVGIRDANGSLRRGYGYDRYNNITTRVDYGDVGNAPDHDDNNLVTYFSYDGLQRLTRIAGAFICGSDCAVDAYGNLASAVPQTAPEILYSYSVENKVATLTDRGGIVTHWHYNGFGEVVREDSRDRGTLVYAYDSAGQLIEKHQYGYIDAELAPSGTFHKTRYAYDTLGRLTAVYFSEIPGEHAEDIIYTYDLNDGAHGKGIGRLTRVQDQSGISDYHYDSLGRVLTQSFDPDGDAPLSFSQHYTYNEVGALTSVTHEPGNHKFNYTYSEGRLNTIDYGAMYDLVVDVDYRPFGGIAGYSNTMYSVGQPLLITTRNYNKSGQLIKSNTNLHNDGGYDVHYNYDAYGNISEIADEWAGTTADQTFEYDPLRRLTRATGLYGQYRYKYDKAGNRLERELYRIDPANPPPVGPDYGDSDTEVFTEHYYYDDGTAMGGDTPEDFISHRLFTVERDHVETGLSLRRRSLHYDEQGNLIEDKREDLLQSSEVKVKPVYGDDNRINNLDVE